MRISEATYYNWKKKYAGLDVIELRLPRQLEEENLKLRQIVAELTLDKPMPQDVPQKKLWGQCRRRAKELLTNYRAGPRRACKVVLLGKSSWYYKLHRIDDFLLSQRIREIAGHMTM